MTFQELNLLPQLLKAVDELGYIQPSPIQAQAIPPVLKGKDLIGCAQTGTGKTAAFAIPILQRLHGHVSKRHTPIRALVLTPTRELALQIKESFDQYGKYLELRHTVIFGGVGQAPQVEALQKGVDILVATPGRLNDLCSQGHIDLSGIDAFVLDEADRMLDMGFIHDVTKLLDQMKNRKNLGLFSATISREVMDIGWLYQRDAEEITVRPVEESRPRITQYCCCTTGRKRFLDLVAILKKENLDRVLIFCNTKYNTAMICDMLTRQGLPAQCIHGDMIQKERNRVMAKFKEGEIPVMVATDVAARGIDVTDIDAVVNYDFPQDNETYVHRIGRTARAQKEGISYLFYSADERTRLKNLIRYTRFEIAPIAVSEDGIISPAEGL